MKMGDGASEACKRGMLRKVLLMVAMWLIPSFLFGIFFPFLLFGGVFLSVVSAIAIFLMSVSTVSVDEEKITYSFYLNTKRQATHLWSEVAESRLTPTTIFLKFKDGEWASFPGTKNPVGQQIATLYLKYLKEQEGEDIIIDELSHRLSNYFAVVFIATSALILLLCLFLLKEVSFPCFIPVVIGLLVIFLPYAMIQRLLIARMVVNEEQIKYSLDQKQEETKRHSWNEVTKARIRPRFIYFRFSNGDGILTSGTKTDIGRKVAEAYESYSSGDSEA